MHVKLSEVVNFIAEGKSAREIMLEWEVPPSKLRRALESVRLNDVMELERQVQTVQMSLAASRYLKRAFQGLVDLMNYPSGPETQRKVCIALIAAATGVNLGRPGVKVFPEGVMAAWRELGGPDAAEAASPPRTPPPKQRADEAALGPIDLKGLAEESPGAAALGPLDLEDLAEEAKDAAAWAEVEWEDKEDQPQAKGEGRLPGDVVWLLEGRIPVPEDWKLSQRASRSDRREEAKRARAARNVAPGDTPNGKDSGDEAPAAEGGQRPSEETLAPGEQPPAAPCHDETEGQSRGQSEFHPRAGEPTDEGAEGPRDQAGDDVACPAEPTSYSPEEDDIPLRPTVQPAAPGRQEAAETVRNWQNPADFGRPVNRDHAQSTVDTELGDLAVAARPAQRGGGMEQFKLAGSQRNENADCTDNKHVLHGYQPRENAASV